MNLVYTKFNFTRLFTSFQGHRGCFVGKKQDLLKSAVELFSKQGFDGTTTFEIAETAHVTEPVIYYHFKNKGGLFTHILVSTFTEYFSRLDKLENHTPTQFEKIENLIDLHFQFVNEFPEETYIILSACPTKLKDSAHICAQQIEKQRQHLTEFISDCLKIGIDRNEFIPVLIEATTGLIIAMVNGLLRRRSLKLDGMRGLKETTVDFCRRSLLSS
jgi:AcrR family transcriptional regulator